MSALELFATLACGLACGGQEQGGASAVAPPLHRIDVRVDRRVELLTLVARLAGFDEFNQPNSKSPYARAVDAWFHDRRDHAAVKKLRELRQSNGVRFDAIPMLAVHLEDSVALEERVPFDAPPERLDVRWHGADARPFLVLLRDFVKVADSEGFFDSQEERFDGAAANLRAVIERSKALPWFDRTFGARSAATYVAIPGLLCGGGNYGVGIRFPPRATAHGSVIDEEILPVFGCSSFDDKGIAHFGDEMAGLIVHELCHSYTNALVDAIAPQLEAPAKRLFESKADALRRQAYGDWKTMSYESLVRASVVRCRTVIEGEPAGRAQAADEVGRGFTWVPALAAELARYDADRKQWPTFVDFLPEIVQCFAREAAKVDAENANAPRLVEMSPENGATDVASGTTQLVLRFDRPMDSHSWSMVGEPDQTPKGSGTPKWDATGREVTIPVTLEAGCAYHFWLNHGKFQDFKSRDGVALVPVEVKFTTRGAQR